MSKNPNEIRAWVMTCMEWDGGSEVVRTPFHVVIGTRAQAESKQKTLKTGKYDDVRVSYSLPYTDLSPKSG
jgi:hypothetical protein